VAGEITGEALHLGRLHSYTFLDVEGYTCT